MQTNVKHIHFVAGPKLDRDAQRDCEARFKLAREPFRGYQLGLSMFDAASHQQGHPLAAQIGRTARQLAD